MRAKQSLFVPIMIVLSWGVVRWQTFENSAASVQVEVEGSSSDQRPITIKQIGGEPILFSSDFRTWPVEAKRAVVPRPQPVRMIEFQSARLGRSPNNTLPSLSILPPIPASSEPNQVGVPLIPAQPAPFVAESLSSQPSRKSTNVDVSYWMLWRNRASRADLVNNSQIGASQSGVRLRAPIVSFQNGLKLSLSGRLSRPLKQGEATEGSIGASLSMGKRVPVELIAERRVTIGQSSDSAWSLIAATGLNELKLTQVTELDGYVQLGVVGARTQRPFIGGNAVISRPLFASDPSRVRIGLGIWGDAQRGATRLDIGPDLTFKSRLRGTSLRLSGQWRIRVAGEAKPSSGPAIVIGGDF